MQHAQLRCSITEAHIALSELKAVCSCNCKEDPKDSDDILIPLEKMSLN